MSGSSSTTRDPAPTASTAHGLTRPRNSFALTGASVPLDPRTHAVRRDLADVRLADRVFAPHYVQPLPRTVTRAAPLCDGTGDDAVVLTQLAVGDRFDLLDVTGNAAWGIAVADTLVGYLPVDALALDDFAT